MFIVKEILEATGGRLISGDTTTAITGISTDTRTINPGDLFIALKGANFDGHSFIGEAIKKGAAGAVVGAPFMAPVAAILINGFDKSNPYILIQVKDTLTAYGDIAHHYRMKFSIPFIGITGSNGKTTAKELVAKVLGSKFYVLKNEGTENNLIGVPKTLFKLKKEDEIGVLELGTNHFGEIKRLSTILAPTLAVITNIAPSHLEFLNSQEDVLREKLELFYALPKNGAAFINADDKFLSKIKRLKCNAIRFGMDNAGDFRAAEIIQEAQGTRFTINGKYDFRIRLLGRHNVYNALLAVSIGFFYGIGFEDIRKSLLEFQPFDGRLCLRRISGITIIDDSYNSNPHSMAAALDFLKSYAGAGLRKVLVCGDMLELGKAAPRFHREVGRIASRAGLDYLIAVGRFSEAVKEGAILDGGIPDENAFSLKDNRAVLETLKGFLREGDILLLKGSRGMRLNEVVDALSSFISSKGVLVRV